MPEDWQEPKNVIITNREIYDMLQQIRDRVYSVETKLELSLRDNAEITKRVRALEFRFYGILAGVIGAVIVLIRSVVG